jgi:hypothetical protein
MMLPIARTEPLCFCHVDGCQRWPIGRVVAGSAKMAVGDGAASCEPKAPFASSGPTIPHHDGRGWTSGTGSTDKLTSRRFSVAEWGADGQRIAPRVTKLASREAKALSGRYPPESQPTIVC